MTLGDYEISISAGCSGYVNISNSAIIEHRPGRLVILPAKPSVVLGPSALPKQFLGVSWQFTWARDHFQQTGSMGASFTAR